MSRITEISPIKPFPLQFLALKQEYEYLHHQQRNLIAAVTECQPHRPSQRNTWVPFIITWKYHTLEDLSSQDWGVKSLLKIWEAERTSLGRSIEGLREEYPERSGELDKLWLKVMGLALVTRVEARNTEGVQGKGTKKIMKRQRN